MGRIPKNKLGFINYNKIYKKCKEFLSLFNTRITPRTIVGTLNVAEQQVVEIIKALSFDCKLLILDEPTSSLTEVETEELFRVIHMLKEKGVTVLYVSHRLGEILRICDRVTVLRDGEMKGTENIADIDTDKMIYMMVGRNIDQLYPPKTETKGVELFRVEDFSSKTHFKDISFSLKKNEILGFSGLVGAGRTELMRAVCGIDRSEKGNVYIEGGKVQIRSYKKAIEAGLVYLTEDRKTEGLFLEFSIKRNIVSAILKDIKKSLFVSSKMEYEIGEKYSKKLNVKANSSNNPCNSLSGGNQQKVLFAKGLACMPKILIVDEPTRGIDVNAKYEIYKILRELCNQGIGVIIVTSDLTEAIGMSDRVIVMREGHITGVVEGGEINEEAIMKYSVMSIA
jgi:ribose transport system ATP-binding protein